MANPQSTTTDSYSDGSSLLGLATWLDEIDNDLADLTNRVRLSKMNEGEVYHTARTRALGAAMSKVGDTLSELLEVLPVGSGSSKTEARTLCIGLISHWLDQEGRSYRRSQVGLHGNTESFSLSNILQFLAVNKKTGLLKVLAPRETVFLELVEGDVVHAASDNAPAGERLGEVLVELGHLSTAQLKQLVGTQNRPKTRLGLALLEKGLVSEEDLREALEVQVRRVFNRLIGGSDALFEFQEEASHRQSLKVRLPTRTLLLEIATCQDEAQERVRNNAADADRPPVEVDELAPDADSAGGDSACVVADDSGELRNGRDAPGLDG